MYDLGSRRIKQSNGANYGVLSVCGIYLRGCWVCC